jgi:hypothetical protein
LRTRVRSSSTSVSIVTIPNLGQREESDCLSIHLVLRTRVRSSSTSVSIVTIPNLDRE